MTAYSRCLEDVHEGGQVGPLCKGPMTSAHIMRWSAAIENWHRIHYDYRFATGHDGLPDILVNGSWKQHVLVQLLKDWMGVDGWLWQIRFRYRAMDLVGDTILSHAEVQRTDRRRTVGLVTCRVWTTNQRQEETTSGMALCVLPLQGGPPVPYPFVPEETPMTVPVRDRNEKGAWRSPERLRPRSTSLWCPEPVEETESDPAEP